MANLATRCGRRFLCWAGVRDREIADEFCVIEPGNNVLVDCGFLGGLTCDGSQQVGHFRKEAPGWPLVWGRDGETAIRSPGGGTKVSWGGPAVVPKTRKNRLGG
jgi:hypothetical protein